MGAKTMASQNEQAEQDALRAEKYQLEKNQRDLMTEQLEREKKFKDRLHLQEELYEQLMEQQRKRDCTLQEGKAYQRAVADDEKAFKESQAAAQKKRKAQMKQYQHDVERQMLEKRDGDTDPAITLAMNETELRLNKHLLERVQQRVGGDDDDDVAAGRISGSLPS